jgi:N-acetylneuraminate synthase
MRDNQIFIIAEAGDNHNGNFDLALQLVDKAAEAGADCVKFQTFVTENVISKFAEKADYQKQTTGENESQYEMVKKLELSFEQFRLIHKYCQEKNIIFLSTPFDLDSIDFLEEIQIPFWKIPSGEITNLPYLEKIAKTEKDIIMSTGMCTMEEIEAALSVLREHGAGKITLLHCNTEYPTPFEDVNLRAMQEMKKAFGVSVGYSDHTVGIAVPIAAAAMGASVIEKHFTLDKNMEGPDHRASLEPEELKQMVRSIRNIERAMGSGKKQPSPSEQKNISIARKSIVAKRKIKQGEQLTEDNLYIKRPGNGISPMRWYEIIGTAAVKDFEEDELIVE